MSNLIDSLKSLFRPAELSAGSVFTIGSAPADEDRRWRVCQIRPLQGVPHAVIEHQPTGHTKTVAVSALLTDRTFQLVQKAA